MKKLVLFAAVAFAATMVSCGGENKTAEADAQAAEATEVEVDAAVATDTVWVNDTTAVVGTDTIIVVKAAPAEAPAETPAE